MMKDKKAQNTVVLEHLKTKKTITPLEALGVYGIFRLGARVYDLKQAGFDIKTSLEKDLNGKRYAKYSLAG